MAPLRRGKEDPFVKFKALWAGVFVEGMESDSEISLSEMDTDLPSTSEGSLNHEGHGRSQNWRDFRK